MRMPRTTIRHLMVIVLLIAMVTWAGITAQRTLSNKSRFHTHFHDESAQNGRDGVYSRTPEWIAFWPVYWRTLLGLPWDWRYECVSGDRHRDVVCEHDFPRLIIRDNGGRFSGFNSELMQSLFKGQRTSQR